MRRLNEWIYCRSYMGSMGYRDIVRKIRVRKVVVRVIGIVVLVVVVVSIGI